jgi:hypothetical protein
MCIIHDVYDFFVTISLRWIREFNNAIAIGDKETLSALASVATRDVYLKLFKAYADSKGIDLARVRSSIAKRLCCDDAASAHIGNSSVDVLEHFFAVVFGK